MSPNTDNPTAPAQLTTGKPCGNDKYLPAPNLFGFEYLFDYSTAQRNKRKLGLPRDTSILVTGRPGAGKSFFTLSLVWEQIRALATERRREQLQKAAAAGGKEEPNSIQPADYGRCALLYVGVQLDEKRVRDRFRDNGWPVDGTDVHIITVRETELPQPLPGAEEVINAILSRLRALILSPRLQDKNQVFVVFDTVTALLKSSAKTGDRQRYITELMSVTKGLLDDRKALCAMVADTTDDPDDPVALEKQVAPDYVFHLGFQESGGGRPARVFEVRKTSHLAHLLLGRHSWERVTRETLKSVFAARLIRKQRLRAHGTEKRWSEVAFIPRPRVYDIGLLQDPKWDAHSHRHLKTIDPNLNLSCGVPGLDQMLRLDRRYWARPSLRILRENYPAPGQDVGDGNKGLISGTVTFLLGRAGTGKTNCGLQFLLADREPKKCLYVNFENRPHRVKQWYPGSSGQKQRLEKCHRLFRHRAHLNVNLLLCEVRCLVLEEKIERVVIDGLSDLVPVLDLKDYGRLVEEFVHTIRLANVRARDDDNTVNPVTIFITLEADPDDPGAKALELTDSPADNVVVFRQVTINDERRKTVEVRKARGQSPDKQVRELVVRGGEDYPLRVIPGLDNYHGLRSDRPEPVSIAVQLIQENVAEGRCNARLVDRLNSLYGYEVCPFGFARGEIVRTLLDIASGTDRIPFSDVKLFHIDEWWVRELRVKALREPGDLLAQSRHPLLRLNQFLAGDERRGADGTRYSPMPADFWAVEMEKVCTPVVAKPSEGAAERPLRADVVALPSYTDYGIFCANRRITQNIDWDTRRWLNEVPRVWAVSDGSGWFRPPNPERPRTVVDLMKSFSQKCGIGFAYDMATPTTSSCFFLELCWAFGAVEEVFVRDTAEYARRKADAGQKDFVKNHPVTQALTLLMYLVAEGLMPRRTTVLDVPRAAFARLWYSTIPDVDLNAIPNPRTADATHEPAPVAPAEGEPPPAPVGAARVWNAVQPLRPETPEEHKTRTDKMFLLPLPFFPVGTASDPPEGTAPDTAIPDPLRIFLADTFARFDRWLDRLEAAVEYRTGLILKDPPKDVRDKITACRKVVCRWDYAGRTGTPQSAPAVPTPTEAVPTGGKPAAASPANPAAPARDSQPALPAPPPTEATPAEGEPAAAAGAICADVRNERGATPPAGGGEPATGSPEATPTGDQQHNSDTSLPPDEAAQPEKKPDGPPPEKTAPAPVGASALTPETAAKLLKELRSTGIELRKVLLGSPLFAYGRAYEREGIEGVPPSFLTAYPKPDGNKDLQYIHLPYAMFVDARDVRELFKWHDFRLDCAEAALAGDPLGNVLFKGSRDTQFTPAVGRVEAVSGFACEGAWAAGADHTTRSPNLSAKVLVELAAAENAADRAWAGAGIPSRKDFFEQYGRQPVPSAPPHAEYDWHQFLKYVGSRSRRRTRAFCSRVELSAVFAEIDRTVFAGLDAADDWRAEDEKDRTVTGLVNHAGDLMCALFDWIAKHMDEQCQSDLSGSSGKDRAGFRSECVTCTNPGGCLELLVSRDGSASSPPATQAGPGLPVSDAADAGGGNAPDPTAATNRESDSAGEEGRV